MQSTTVKLSTPRTQLIQSLDRFSKLIINGEPELKEWTSIRQTKNYQDDHGVTDINSVDLRCFQMKAGSGTATIAAGGTLGFVADQGITHPGPVQFYMAKVPEGKDINTWDASGNVWFKAASIGAASTPGAKALSWPTYRESDFTACFVCVCVCGRYADELKSSQEKRNVYDPQEPSERRLPCPGREHSAAPGAVARRRPVLPGMRSTYRHRWRKWEPRPIRIDSGTVQVE